MILWTSITTSPALETTVDIVAQILKSITTIPINDRSPLHLVPQSYTPYDRSMTPSHAAVLRSWQYRHVQGGFALHARSRHSVYRAFGKALLLCSNRGRCSLSYRVEAVVVQPCELALIAGSTIVKGIWRSRSLGWVQSQNADRALLGLGVRAWGC